MSKVQSTRGHKDQRDKEPGLLARPGDTIVRVEIAPEPAPAQEPATAVRSEARHIPATARTHRDRRREIDVDFPKEFMDLLGKLILILHDPESLAESELSIETDEPRLVFLSGDGILVFPENGRKSHDDLAFRRIVLLDLPQEIVLPEDVVGAGLRNGRNLNLNSLDRAKLASFRHFGTPFKYSTNTIRSIEYSVKNLINIKI